MTSPFGDLIQFASKNRGDGVLIEPRFYYDTLDFTTLPGAEEADPYTLVAQNSDSAAYTNGEQFPVRITHMVVSPLHTPVTGESYKVIYQRPSGAQSLWLRVERYSEYYMNESFIRATAWHNVQSAQPYNAAAGTVTHKFFQPLVLSARDSLRVDFEAVFPGATTMAVPIIGGESGPMPTTLNPDNAAPSIFVQLTGVGMRSGQPYFLAGPARPTTDGGSRLFSVDPANLQNLGNEPIAVTEMTVNASLSVEIPEGEGSTTTVLSDVRFFRMRVRQQGNGTQAELFRGPVYPTPMERMPLSLFGTHLGDAVVHRLPGDGIQLDPGEVLRVSGQNARYVVNRGNIAPIPTLYAVGFAGYLMVT